MKTRTQIGWLLAVALMVCACQSDRVKTRHPELFRNGYVTVAGVANNTQEADETMSAIGRVFSQAGIKVGFDCLSVCDVRVPEKDRQRALDLLAKNPELKVRPIHIFTDAEIKRMKEPKVPVFSMAGRSLMQRMPDFKVIKQVFNDAGLRWQLKQEEDKVTISVATSQKRAALRLVKDNPALKGIDVQVVEQKGVK